jgi:hypothetical protein
MYTLLQTALWWLFHTIALFWKVLFPFHARSFKTSRKTKYTYYASILAGLLIPVVPIIASMADFSIRVNTDQLLLKRGVSFGSGGLGYGVIRFPPILCMATNSDIVYYGIVLPINIIMMVGITLLTVIFWTIHKVIPNSLMLQFLRLTSESGAFY